MGTYRITSKGIKDHANLYDAHSIDEKMLDYLYEYRKEKVDDSDLLGTFGREYKTGLAELKSRGLVKSDDKEIENGS